MLRDAGADEPDILTHCRRTGPHVRGCWVVDLVVGKGEEWAGGRHGCGGLVIICYGVLRTRAPFDPQWSANKTR
ncbi:MAG TPA: hypothetical protein VKE74_25530 [Gemmataceae bacterium]|nr:hypothetical protein [Gemmataceae bacterium]